MNKQHFDIVISGGGLSGALTALSLASLKLTLDDGSTKPLSIAIVESATVSSAPASKTKSLSFDARVLALSHGSAQYLTQVGAWQHIQPYAEAIDKIHISDRNFPAKARLSANEHHVDALGYVVEMARIGQGLYQALSAFDNIIWFSPDTINEINWHKKHVDISLASGGELVTQLLLGCDGAQSVCRQFAKIDVSSDDYQQVALIANVATSLAHNNVAFERFTENGPIAMLPLVSSNAGESRCSLVWTMTPSQATQIQSLSDSEFCQTLEQAFGTWLGNVTRAGHRDIYPLKLVRAHEQIYHRMALIGNASHTIHPIAGQGFNLGLRDVAILAEHLAKHLTNSSDVGSFSLLNCYAVQRKNDHNQVIGLTDSLVTLFSNQLPPLVVGRNIGLKVLDHVGGIKSALVNKTMGY